MHDVENQDFYIHHHCVWIGSGACEADHLLLRSRTLYICLRGAMFGDSGNFTLHTVQIYSVLDVWYTESTIPIAVTITCYSKKNQVRSTPIK
jgi:hypothetical protein